MKPELDMCKSNTMYDVIFFQPFKFFLLFFIFLILWTKIFETVLLLILYSLEENKSVSGGGGAELDRNWGNWWWEKNTGKGFGVGALNHQKLNYQKHFNSVSNGGLI